MKCDENTAAIWECKEGDPNKWVFLNYCFTGEKVRNFTRNHGNELNIASPVRLLMSSVTMIHQKHIKDRGALYADNMHEGPTPVPNAVFLLPRCPPVCAFSHLLHILPSVSIDLLVS